MGWVRGERGVVHLHSGLATELLVDDALSELAEGEAMDLAQGAAFYPTASVLAASINRCSTLTR